MLYFAFLYIVAFNPVTDGNHVAVLVVLLENVVCFHCHIFLVIKLFPCRNSHRLQGFQPFGISSGKRPFHYFVKYCYCVYRCCRKHEFKVNDVPPVLFRTLGIVRVAANAVGIRRRYVNTPPMGQHIGRKAFFVPNIR